MNEATAHRDLPLADLAAFAAICRAGTFTRAAATLGVTQSALSHRLRTLEARLGAALLVRTTRRVAPTAAGEQLLARLAPALDDIAEGLAELGRQRGVPAGRLRLTTFKLAAQLALWPVLPRFLEAHPAIEVETQITDGLTDIVAERFDAGIRLGGTVEKDMVGVPIGPPQRLVTLASPAYLSRHGHPRQPADLLRHPCLRYRLTSSGELFPWRFRRGGRVLNVKVQGPMISNDNDTLLHAAMQGLGVVQVFDGLAQPALAAGALELLLPAWNTEPSRLTLYFPHRRQASAALRALVDWLRENPDPGTP